MGGQGEFLTSNLGLKTQGLGLSTFNIEIQLGAKPEDDSCELLITNFVD
ncbi:hypothetical protein Cylst_2266 [Cylindrospermum stagnale PCC 7417]|uniref:Uncharacterized protein n=1 Tax=Cylindrospermum stagnale PCC 7417 TaxID=56107 RepID=K9WXG7_9NOST|nr:hypothetical protein Cylst_2266 [Cylindrospermum stagnale PCC 7417]